jgi:UDP-N-acetylglucosamine diphosphorylase/glucosamine-1-phosphate N-acetyltransferase
MRLCIYEDAGCAGLEPLTLTRPAFDLRCGAATLLERQLRRFAAGEAGALVRPFLAEMCRYSHPDMKVNDAVWMRGAAALVNARWLPDSNAPIRPAGPEVGVVGDRVAYVVLPEGEAAEASAETLGWRLEGWRGALPNRPAGGRLVAYPWDLVERNGDMVRLDHLEWAARRGRTAAPPGVAVVGPADQVVIDPSARLEPMVLIDATSGPVLIDAGAFVQAFSRLEGPCYVGRGSHVLGAKVRGASIGPHCRVGGEVECSVLHGFANKAHDGFLGHSYVGEWVNLGAGAQISDLRTDYGTVVFQMGGRRVDSGLLKVGAFFGDHAKTSINAQLNTGTVAGPFSQLLTTGGLLPRLIPAFCRVSHGRLVERTDLREMFETAAAAMGRRGREWTEHHADFFLALYERTEAERRQTIRESEQRRLRRVV